MVVASLVFPNNLRSFLAVTLTAVVESGFTQAREPDTFGIVNAGPDCAANLQGATTMVAATMSIDLDPETAEAVAEATPEERKKWALLLRLRLRELTSLSPRSLQQVMDDIGAKAAAAGLTPEILESLLNDE